MIAEYRIRKQCRIQATRNRLRRRYQVRNMLTLAGNILGLISIAALCGACLAGFMNL